MEWDEIKDITLALIAIGLIFGFVTLIISVMNNPDKLWASGATCRTSLLINNRVTELSEHLASIKPRCKVIEKEIPLRDSYFNGVKLKEMTATQYSDAVTRDFVELAARAWWMTGEGDVAESKIDSIFQTLSSSNKCLVVIAAKMRDPKDVGNSVKNFNGITKEDIDTASGQYSTQDIFGKLSSRDQTIRDYFTEGYDAGVSIIISEQKNNKFDDALITRQKPDSNNNQIDAIYGIAVGFDQVSSLKAWFSETWFASVLGIENKQRMNEHSKYIIIAPYDQIIKYCAVQNE